MLWQCVHFVVNDLDYVMKKDQIRHKLRILEPRWTLKKNSLTYNKIDKNSDKKVFKPNYYHFYMLNIWTRKFFLKKERIYQHQAPL